MSGVAENLLLQDFRPQAPNRCWAGDITYIRTTAGWPQAICSALDDLLPAGTPTHTAAWSRR
jgi:transposase InsO family protein